MKILYTYKTNTTPLYIGQSNQNQRLLVWFEDSSDWFVYYCCDLSSQVYINRVINKHSNPSIFFLDNFEVIKDDKQFNTYQKFLEKNYNFLGIYKDEKIDG